VPPTYLKTTIADETVLELWIKGRNCHGLDEIWASARDITIQNRLCKPNQ